jgi:ABC-type glycerol-3-phosphate transport system substrate-binding protein
LNGKWKSGIAAVLLVLMTVIAGCGGGGTKDTVNIFMMLNGVNPDIKVVESIESQLKDKLGEDSKVEFSTAPIYNIQKLMVEYAAAMNDIVILSKDDVMNYGKSGANMPLDEFFNPEDYPEGVFEGGIMSGESKSIVQEKHLYAIPLTKLKMFKDAGFAPDDAFLTISVSADSVEQSIAAIKAMME